MPTIQDNLLAWNVKYDWTQQGDEWSASSGGVEAQWRGAIFPRIHTFVPTVHILEIGPGFGRWTQYLRNLCQRLSVVDLAPRCIEACKARFSADSHITYYVNDGKSLAMLPDESVDFVFSFDSLVHADAEVLEAYLRQLASKLKPTGVGFIHHSNLGAYRSYFALTKRIPRGRGLLIEKGLIDDDHWRAEGVTAKAVAEYCEKAQLHCVGQELMNCGGRRLIDCVSVFARRGSTWAGSNEALPARRL